MSCTQTPLQLAELRGKTFFFVGAYTKKWLMISGPLTKNCAKEKYHFLRLWGHTCTKKTYLMTWKFSRSQDNCTQAYIAIFCRFSIMVRAYLSFWKEIKGILMFPTSQFVKFLQNPVLLKSQRCEKSKKKMKCFLAWRLECRFYDAAS